MEDSRPLSSSNSSSSENFSSINPTDSYMPRRAPQHSLKPKLSHVKSMKESNQPTFIRFIRANTSINTVLSDFGDHKSYIPKLSKLTASQKTKNFKNTENNSKKNPQNPENELKKNKELLYDFIKVREATGYELVNEKKLANYSGLIKAIFYIKVSISELCRLISTNVIFETLIICVIFANTLTIALDSIYPIPSNLESAFLLIYTSECIIKIFASGLFKPHKAYLRDKWNILDLSIIITGWVESFQYKLNVLRTLRILRPLRNISSIKGLRVIFMALISAAKPLGGTLGTLMFFIFIFAIAGIQTMMGAFRFRCMDIETGLLANDKGLCGNSNCQENWACVDSLQNPMFNMVSFDSIFYALIIVFECVTLQTWVPLMNVAQLSVSYAMLIYYIPLTFVGTFLILNLTLAVIKSAFTRSMEKVRTPKINPDLEEQILDSSLESYQDEEKEKFEIEKTIFKEKIEELHVTQREPLIDIRRLRRSSSNIMHIDLENISEKKTVQEETKVNHRKKRSSTLVMAMMKKQKTKEKYEVRNYVKKKSQKIERQLSEKIENLIVDGIAKLLMAAPCNHNEKFDKLNDMKSSHVFHKLKHSISIRKDLIKNMKKNKKINKIKLVLSEKFVFTSESTEEVLPKLQGFEAISHSFSGIYSFTYKPTDMSYESELEKIWRLESEYFFSKHPESKMKVFNYFSLKTDPLSAFQQITGSALEKVRCISIQDEIKCCVEGSWSGSEVFQEDERNLYFLTDLSSMKYRLWDSGVSSYIQKLQAIAKIIENSRGLIVTMIVIVVLNALILSIEHYGMSQDMENAISTINLGFNLMFISELFIRVIALGISQFCRDSMNYIDTIVIILSFLELSVKIGSSALSAFRVVRIIRILRIYRFARALTFMKSLVCVITYSLPKFIYLALLLALLNLVYALLGYQLFAGKFVFEHEEPRSNFDNFGWAYLTVFQVLTLSNYSEVLYNVMRSSAGPWSALYILVWIIIGNFVLLNLFIAILLDSFIQEGEELENMSLLERTLTFSKKNLFAQDRSKTLKKKEVEKMRVLHAVNSSTEKKPEKSKDSSVPLFYNITCKKSFFIFSQTNWFRILCYRISSSKAFSIVAFIVIYVNCIILVLETYTLNSPSNNRFVLVLKACETAFTAFYLLEFLIKTVATGVFDGENAYFKETWQVLDFFILVISCLDTFSSQLNLTSLKVFRVIRSIRPLRFISRNATMRQLVSALFSSISAIANVILVMLVVWFMFAVLGVSVFSGKLYSCSNELIETELECTQSGYSWENSEMHFDNIFEAFLSLFIIGMLEGWHEIMYKCIDAKGQKIAGTRDYNFSAAYFFIFFIYVGAFFFLHLFMGVVFLKFHQAKKEASSVYVLLLSKPQMFWIEMQRLVVKESTVIQFKKPENAVKARIYYIVTNDKFEIFIFITILLNMLSMSMAYKDSSFEYNYILEMANIGCVAIFTIEFILKVYAFGLNSYCKSKWNTFDGFVIVCAYIEIALDSQIYTSTKILRTAPQIFRIFRIFKVSRLIRIFKPLKNLQNLVTIVFHSLPAILNVVSLFVLCIFIYAILGVFLFSSVSYGKFIDEFNNFSDFGMACLMLLRISTLGDWPFIMTECAAVSGRTVAALYFSSFMVITVLVILNLFIMVIIQNYEDFEMNPNSSLHIFTKQTRKFNLSWEKFSGFSHGIKICHKNLLEFMNDLGPVLGFDSEISFNDSIRMLSDMAFTVDDDGNVHYHDMLYAVLKRKYGISPNNCSDQVPSILLRKEERKTIKKLKNLQKKSEWMLFKKNSAKILDLKAFRKQKTRNLFLSILLARRLLKGWREVVRKKKSGEVNITENSDF